MALPFSQPRVTPWVAEKRRMFSGPTGQPFASRVGEFLARWADHTSRQKNEMVGVSVSQGVALGWANACPFGAKTGHALPSFNKFSY